MSRETIRQLAPIVLFAYNRPNQVLKTLHSLSRNQLAEKSHLFVYADGWKIDGSVQDQLKIAETKKIVLSKKWCKQVTLIERETNFGLANNILQGVTETLLEYDSVIVLEDDMITSPAFLTYMNDALQMYRYSAEVACISGYCYPIKKLPETFFIKGSDCWGWATWKRAWCEFEKDGTKLLHELETRNSTNDFDFNGTYPFTQMLRDQISGKNDSWAIRWYASCYLRDSLCLYPSLSFVHNIGLDGSGVHCEPEEDIKPTLNEGFQLKEIAFKENLQAKGMFGKYLAAKNKDRRANTSYIKKLLARLSLG